MNWFGTSPQRNRHWQFWPVTAASRQLRLATGSLVMLFAPQLMADLQLVEIKNVAPTIVIDLRYATPHNVTGHALYPPGMRALVIPSVAQQLAGAQNFLRHYDYGLKIWDAYRPKEAQELLWRLAAKGDYVSDPESGIGSTHSWGVSVDASLVDRRGRPVAMPTDFDEFTPAATMYYQGNDPIVRAHLRILQVAMGGNNFYGLRIEWWHFTTADWKKYVPAGEIEEARGHKPQPEKVKPTSLTNPTSKT